MDRPADSSNIFSSQKKNIYLSKSEDFSSASISTSNHNNNNNNKNNNNNDSYNNSKDDNGVRNNTKRNKMPTKFQGLKLEALRLERKISKDIANGTSSTWKSNLEEKRNRIAILADDLVRVKPSLNPYGDFDKSIDRDNLNNKSLSRPRSASLKSSPKKESINQYSIQLNSLSSSQGFPVSTMKSIDNNLLSSVSSSTITTMMMMPKLPVDDALHSIMEEELAVLTDMNSPTPQPRDLDLYRPITRQEIRNLAQFESPPPELWIVARICFFFTVFYFNEIEKEIYKSATYLSTDDYLKHSVDSNHLHHNAVFHLLFLRYGGSIMPGKVIIEDFSWNVFKQILSLDKDFTLLLNSMDRLACNNDQNLDSQNNFFSKMTEDDIGILRELTKPHTFHPASCLYFSKPAAHVCAIVRRLAARAYQISICKNDLRDSLNTTTTISNRTTNHINVTSDEVSTFQSHGSWIASCNIFSGTSRHRWQQLLTYSNTSFSNDHLTSKPIERLSFVACVKDKSIEAANLSLTCISVADTFSNVDILVLPSYYCDETNSGESESNTITTLNQTIHDISASPLHRVFDLRENVSTILRDTDVVEHFHNVEESKRHHNDNAVVASFEAMTDKRNFANREEKDTSHKPNHDNMMSNMLKVNVKDILNYFKYKSLSDVLVLPLSVFQFTDTIEDSHNSSNTSQVSKMYDSPIRSLARELYTSTGRQRNKRVCQLALLSFFDNTICTSTRHVVLVTDSQKSIAAYKIANRMTKPGDVIIALHVPFPTLTDIEFVSTLDKNDMFGDKWKDLRHGKALMDRLKGRANRLSLEYQSQGCNLLIADYCDSLTLLKCYQLVINDHDKKSFYKLMVESLLHASSELNSTFLHIGATSYDIDHFAKSGVESMLDILPSSCIRTYSSLSVGIVESCQCSLVLSSEEESSQ